MSQNDENYAYRLRFVRKTYGAAGRIPKTLFQECRLTGVKRPVGADWRNVCGTEYACRAECPKCWALSIDNLEIRRGTTHGILGHSGSGKTTLLNLLALLDEPDSDLTEFALNPGNLHQSANGATQFSYKNRAWRDSRDRAVTANSIRRDHFGFVFQAGHLTSHLSAIHNVAMPMALRGAKSRDAVESAGNLLEKVRFGAGRQRALPRNLSGGEYQRVAVARALAHGPQVVFADEPTGNLDPVTATAVMELLTEWRREHPERTLVLITHNIEQAVKYCDHITVLSGGRTTYDQGGPYDEKEIKNKLAPADHQPPSNPPDNAQASARSAAGPDYSNGSESRGNGPLDGAVIPVESVGSGEGGEPGDGSPVLNPGEPGGVL